MVSTTIINMPSAALPRFIPASQGASACPQTNLVDNNDSLDFDLLAEYLLDDGTGIAGLDFG